MIVLATYKIETLTKQTINKNNKLENEMQNTKTNNLKSIIRTYKSTTMKNLILVLSFMLTSGILSAQFKIGLKGSSPSISSKEVTKQFYNIDRTGAYELNYLSTRTSYAYGLGLYQEVGPAFISADILFRSKAVQYDVKDLNSRNRGAAAYEDKYKEITVPVVAGWRKNDLKLGVGPVFTFKAQSEHALAEMPEFTVSQRKLNTGFQFLVGYIIKDRIHVDLKRELNFNQTGEDYQLSGKNLNLKSLPHTGSISVGIFF